MLLPDDHGPETSNVKKEEVAARYRAELARLLESPAPGARAPSDALARLVVDLNLDTADLSQVHHDALVDVLENLPPSALDLHAAADFSAVGAIDDETLLLVKRLPTL